MFEASRNFMVENWHSAFLKQDRERSYRSFAMCMDDRIESSRIYENSKMRRIVPNIIITALFRLLPSKMSSA